MRFFLRAKIHRATVTEANVDYTGSVTIDKSLMDECGISKGEKVDVWDIDNGERLSTYAIEGSSGEICMNGAAALKIKKGHRIIITSYELSEKPIKPKIILVDKNNKFMEDISKSISKSLLI